MQTVCLGACNCKERGCDRMQYRLLIADDDPDICAMLKDFFEMSGYLVETAHTGVETLEALKGNPDLILLDINMPEMDGITVCKRIRNQVNVPIVFLTAKIEEQDRVNGFLAGGDDYIMKPFSMDELLARVAAHLRREERGRDKKQLKTVRYLPGKKKLSLQGRSLIS